MQFVSNQSTSQSFVNNWLFKPQNLPHNINMHPLSKLYIFSNQRNTKKILFAHKAYLALEPELVKEENSFPQAFFSHLKTFIFRTSFT